MRKLKNVYADYKETWPKTARKIDGASVWTSGSLDTYEGRIQIIKDIVRACDMESHYSDFDIQQAEKIFFDYAYASKGYVGIHIHVGDVQDEMDVRFLYRP